MTRTWTVCRQPSPRRDGDRRWDQAYQLLVCWAAERPDDTLPVEPVAQEVPDACRGVRAGLDHPPSPGADHPAAARPAACGGRRARVALDERHVYRDDGYSGAKLARPGLDCLRD